MFKSDIVNDIETCGAMAIVRVENLERAFEIAEGCLCGGINIMEISYTYNNAGKIIEGLSKNFKDQLQIGAGTVLDAETCRMAILAGAKFIIAPNYNHEVAIMCNRYQIPYAPGCSTMTEAIQALEMGASYIKAFPISNFYGPKLGKVMMTPIPNLPLLASGGANLDNIEEWLENGVSCIGFGSLLTRGSRQEIEMNAKKIRNKIDEYRQNKRRKYE